MTPKQKAARERFSKIVAEAKKLRAKNKNLTQAQAVKQAWAISYNKTGSSKKVGALPIDFKGNFLGYRFKIINQYQIDGKVTAQLVEIDPPGNIIAQLTGNTKENDRVIGVLIASALSIGNIYLDKNDEKAFRKAVKDFVTGLNKEVAAYNSGKDTKTKKSKGVSIKYTPTVKKLAVIDQIKNILADNKKILPGGYRIKSGEIRAKIAGYDPKKDIFRYDNPDHIKYEIEYWSTTIKELKADLKDPKYKTYKNSIQEDIKLAEKYLKQFKDALLKIKSKKISGSRVKPSPGTIVKLAGYTYPQTREIVVSGIGKKQQLESLVPDVKLRVTRGKRTGTDQIKSVYDSVEIFRKWIGNNKVQTQELLCVMFLNQSNKVLGVYSHSTGAINQTTADVRLIMAAALKMATVSIIICHNHPSGNLVPSEADLKMTKMLQKACEFHNINLFDHIILTKDSYKSFAEDGLI